MAQSEVVDFSKVVLIGGSAGSLEVLLQLLPQLKTTPAFPIIIVIHRKPSTDSPMTELLSARSSLKVREVEEKDDLKAGVVYVVPADYHVLFEKDGTLSLDASEKINYSRPSIDVVFESAAEAYGAAVTAILLSGANADGTHGFEVIKQMGGTTIAQDPSTAEIAYMPERAIQKNMVDQVLDIPGIAAYLNNL